MSTCYIVTTIRHVDDYKCRGDAWSSIDKQEAFENHDDAKEFARRSMIEYVRECADEYDAEESTVADDISWDDLDKLIDEHLKGECTERLYTYEIREEKFHRAAAEDSAEKKRKVM